MGWGVMRAQQIYINAETDFLEGGL